MGTRAAITNGPVTNGSKYRSRRLSAKRPSLWRRSGWLTTSASRRAGPFEPSIVQGLVSCRKCGYALSRTSARTSARKIHYYRCLGSDAWRHRGGPVCNSRPIRQDLLDQIVWQEVIHLIEDPTLIQAELDRRLEAARAAEPAKRRREALERELTRIRKSIERLLTAY